MKADFLLKLALGLTLGVLVASCAGNPNKAEKITTDIEKKEVITGDESVGIKDGNMVVQKKVAMSEELRRLQYDVYSLEDRVFGNRKYGSLGLYGALKECKMNVSDKKNGGDGKLIWTEPMDRVTEKEDEFKIGIDEKDQLVGISEEFIKDRISRFRGYRNLLEKRQDEYEDKVSICKTQLKAQLYDKEKNNAEVTN